MNRKLESLTFSFALTLAIIAQYIRAPRFDSDIIWSVAIGKWINLNRAFPVVDSFSWTINGKEWMTHEWMYSYLAFQMSDAFGSLGLYVLTFIPILVTIYFLYLIASKYDEYGSYAYVLVFTLGVFLLYMFALPFRAYIYALLFVTLLIYLLYFKEEKPWDFLLYIVLFMLWANFQVSVFIGLVILAAELMRQLIIYPATRIKVLIIGIGSVIATFINPYGYKLWIYFLFVTTNMSDHRNIQEWQAVDFNEPLILLVYLGIAASVLLLHFYNMKRSISRATQDSSKKGLVVGIVNQKGSTGKWNSFIDWIGENFTREACLLIGFWCFYIYALYSVRMLVFSIILWIILVGHFVGKSQRFHFARRTYHIFVVFFLILAFASLSMANFEIKDIFTCNKKVSPVEEVAFLKKNPVYSEHLFNQYLFGGYLITHDIPVFIDARCDSYIKFGILQKYIAIDDLDEDPQVLLDELGVENLLITDGPLKKYIEISPKWALVYGGPTAFVYTRTAY